MDSDDVTRSALFVKEFGQKKDRMILQLWFVQSRIQSYKRILALKKTELVLNSLTVCYFNLYQTTVLL